MLPDFAEFSALGVELSPDAAVRINAAEACELCGIEPLDRRWDTRRKLAWLNRFRSRTDSAATNAPVAQNAEEEDHVWYGDAGVGTELQRLAWDTRLEATVAIETDVLEKVAPRLEPEAVAFVGRWFTVAACLECRSVGSRGEAPAAFLEAKYLAVHYDGSRGVAERQPSWLIATAIFGILDEAASGSREVG